MRALKITPCSRVFREWEIERRDVTLALDPNALRENEPRMLILTHSAAPRFSFERIVFEEANR